MRLKVLVNPAAGRGRARRKISAALAVLRAGAEIDLEESESGSHLVELGRAASVGAYDAVVACGGDGTVNRVIRHFDLHRGTLGIIPLGSGDDFARTLGVSANAEEAAATVLRGNPRPVNVAAANGVRFLVAASIGFDAAVARYVAENRFPIRGPAIYAWAAVRNLARFHPLPLTIEVDGTKHDQQVMFVVAANAFRYGGGVQIAPDALLDDDILDLMIIGKASKLDLLTTLPMAYRGLHTRRPFVHSLRGREFRIAGSEPLDVFADGEFVTRTPAVITLEKQRLRVLA